jgi:hypothetical protein
MSGFAVVAITAAQNARVAVARAGGSALRHARTGVVPVVVGIEVPDGIGMEMRRWLSLQSEVIGSHSPSVRPLQELWLMAGLPKAVAVIVLIISHIEVMPSSVMFRYNHHPHRCTLSAAPGWMSEFAVVAITAGQNARIAVARAGRSALHHARAGVVPVVVGIEVPDGIGMEMRRWLSSQSEVIGHITPSCGPLQELWLMAGLPKVRRRRCPDNKSHRSDAVICHVPLQSSSTPLHTLRSAGMDVRLCRRCNHRRPECPNSGSPRRGKRIASCPNRCSSRRCRHRGTRWYWDGDASLAVVTV